MVDRPTYPPPPPARDDDERERHSERPGPERSLQDFIKRGLEAGRGKFERNLGESFFPKDMASQLVAGIGDLRQGVVTAVAQEVGRFLRQADIASEIRQVLNGLEVDATVHLAFRESKTGGLKADVKVDGRPRRRWRGRRNAEATEALEAADSSDSRERADSNDRGEPRTPVEPADELDDLIDDPLDPVDDPLDPQPTGHATGAHPPARGGRGKWPDAPNDDDDP